MFIVSGSGSGTGISVTDGYGSGTIVNIGNGQGSGENVVVGDGHVQGIDIAGDNGELSGTVSLFTLPCLFPKQALLRRALDGAVALHATP
jgi:hypothetical protein